MPTAHFNGLTFDIIRGLNDPGGVDSRRVVLYTYSFYILILAHSFSVTIVRVFATEVTTALVANESGRCKISSS